MTAPEHHAIRAWRAALEPLPGIKPRLPEYVTHAGDDLCRALEAAEAARREADEHLRRAVALLSDGATFGLTPTEWEIVASEVRAARDALERRG